MNVKEWPKCTPEEAGISSAAIEKWLSMLKKRDLTMHGAMIVRGGKCVFEAYWKPVEASFMHRLYSCSKSFVSVAVGMAVEQGLLSLDDRCVDFFPERVTKLEGGIDLRLARMTVRDCLRMATCWTKGSNYSASCHDWIASFFEDEVTHVPGTVYNYCTSGTTMLCCILKRVSEKQFTEVLRPVFDRIGISKDAFCVLAPEGSGEYVEWGGSGVVMTMRDFARFAELCMHYGVYEGEHLLPEAYMREATSRLIDNGLDGGDEYHSTGYGYQFWMMPEGGFGFVGMGGQFALCFPEKDLMLVTTGYEELNSTARAAIFDGLYEYILPSLNDGPLPEDPDALRSLTTLADSLELPCARGQVKSDRIDMIDSRWYRMDPNEMGLYSSCFTFADGECTWEYENRTGYHVMTLGMCRNIEQEFPERYCDIKIDKKAEKGYRAFCSAAFTTPDTLRVEIRVLDTYLAQARLDICFKDDTVTLRGYKHAEWFMDEFAGYASGFFAD